MAESSGNFAYTVVEGDSLKKIAQKHGLSPVNDWARKIWEHPRNGALHSDADMHGRTVKRQLHMGNSRYRPYDHSRWQAGYRGFDDPHQIILYSGEIIWIPKTEEEPRAESSEEQNQEVQDDQEEQNKPEIKRKKHILNDDELIKGFVSELCKKYDLIFPVYRIRMYSDEVNDDDVLILTGKTETDEILYKKTLLVNENKIENNQYIDLHFIGTPKSLKYTLEVEPGQEAQKKTEVRYNSENIEDTRSDYNQERKEGNEEGEKPIRYTVFSEEPYPYGEY